MYKALAICSSFRALALAITLILFTQLNALQAGGWGTKGRSETFEGAKWKKTYYDMEGMYFTTSLPGYSGTSMRNNEVSLGGGVEGSEYVVTTYNLNFSKPKSGQAFKKLVAKNNRNIAVQTVNAKKFGAKYAVEFTLKNGNQLVFWRMLCTKNRFIKMGTTDLNQKRRNKFFNSISIK